MQRITVTQARELLKGFEDAESIFKSWTKKGYIRQELLPCPTCGKKAVGLMDWKMNYSVACSFCATRIDFYDEQNIAVHIWNTNR